MLLDIQRQSERMFNHLPLHVDDPEPSVWTIGKLHGAKPIIGRGDQFTLSIDSLGPHARPVRRQSLAMHQIASHIADDEHPG